MHGGRCAIGADACHGGTRAPAGNCYTAVTPIRSQGEYPGYVEDSRVSQGVRAGHSSPLEGRVRDPTLPPAPLGVRPRIIPAQGDGLRRRHRPRRRRPRHLRSCRGHGGPGADRGDAGIGARGRPLHRHPRGRRRRDLQGRGRRAPRDPGPVGRAARREGRSGRRLHRLPRGPAGGCGRQRRRRHRVLLLPHGQRLLRRPHGRAGVEALRRPGGRLRGARPDLPPHVHPGGRLPRAHGRRRRLGEDGRSGEGGRGRGHRRHRHRHRSREPRVRGRAARHDSGRRAVPRRIRDRVRQGRRHHLPGRVPDRRAVHGGRLLHEDRGRALLRDGLRPGEHRHGCDGRVRLPARRRRPRLAHRIHRRRRGGRDGHHRRQRPRGDLGRRARLQDRGLQGLLVGS